MTISVKARVSAYHPATGLRLEEGQPYDIDEAQFSDAVFSRAAAEAPAATPAGQTENGGEE